MINEAYFVNDKHILNKYEIMISTMLLQDFFKTEHIISV